MMPDDSTILLRVRNRLNRRLYSILIFSHTTAMDFCLALISIMFGLWIIFLDPFLSAPRTFGVFLQLADSNIWGLVVFTIGMFQLISVLLEYRRIIRLTGLCGFLIWTLITGLFLLSNAGSPMIPLSAGIALMFALSYIHNGVNT
jgi:hypothetical protein